MMVTVTSFAIPSILYALPKLASHLSTKPAQVENNYDKLRTTLADYQIQLRNKLGESNYKVLTRVIIDNAWISSYVLMHLMQYSTLAPQPFNLEKAVNITLGFIAIGTLSWTIRHQTSKYLPLFAQYVANFIEPIDNRYRYR